MQEDISGNMYEDMEEEYEKLTELQKRFIDFYIETANATKACEMAGYKGKNLNRIGSENLSKLDKFIKVKLQEKEKERIASQDEVLIYFTEIMRDDKNDVSDRTKCAELLGKRFGLFKDKLELEQNKPFEVNISIKKK